jgi:hypothetical protein
VYAADPDNLFTVNTDKPVYKIKLAVTSLQKQKLSSPLLYLERSLHQQMLSTPAFHKNASAQFLQLILCKLNFSSLNE